LNRSEQPDNCTTGSLLLTIFALSHDKLLATLRESQVLRCVELALHSGKILATQDNTWNPAWHAVDTLQQVLTSRLPIDCFLIKPYSDERVLQIWRDIGSVVSVLQAQIA
jgi:hypothetical protein